MNYAGKDGKPPPLPVFFSNIISLRFIALDNMTSCINMNYKENRNLLGEILDRIGNNKLFGTETEKLAFVKAKLQAYMSITGEAIEDISPSEFTKFIDYSLKYYSQKDKSKAATRKTILSQMRSILSMIDRKTLDDFTASLADAMKLRFTLVAKRNSKFFLDKAASTGGEKSNRYREAAKNETWNTVYHKTSLRDSLQNYIDKLPTLAHSEKFIASLKKQFLGITEEELGKKIEEYNNRFLTIYNTYQTAPDYFLQEIRRILSEQDDYSVFIESMSRNDADALEDTPLELDADEANDDNGEGMLYTKTRTQSIHKTISQGVKTLFSHIPLLNSNGKVVTNAAGTAVYMNPESMLNYCISYLSNSSSQEEFWDKWGKLCSQFKWAELINTRMGPTTEDSLLRNLFYHNLNKHSVTHTYLKKGHRSRPRNRTGKDTMRDRITNELIGASYTDFNSGEKSLRNPARYNAISQALKKVLDRVDALVKSEKASQRGRIDPVFTNGTASSFKEDILKFAKKANLSSIINDQTFEASFHDDVQIDNLVDLLNAVSSIIESFHNASEPISIDDFNAQTQSKLWEATDSLAKVLDFGVNQTSLPSIFHNRKAYAAYLSPSYLSNIFLNLSDYSKVSAYIGSNFRPYANFFSETLGKFYFTWLDDMSTGKKSPRLVTCLSYNGKDMNEQSPAWRLSQMISAFYSKDDTRSKDSALFTMPMLGDSMHDLYVQIGRMADRGDYSPIIDSLSKVVLYEINRMSQMDSANSIAGWSAGKNAFTFFPKLNSLKIGNKTLLSALKTTKEPETRTDIINKYLSTMLEEELADFKAYCKEIGFDATFMDKNNNERSKYLYDEFDPKTNASSALYDSMLSDFFYESYHARIQMIGILGIDPAFYGRGDDFFKRFLGAQSSMQRPNVDEQTKAKVIVIKDVCVDGKSIDGIRGIMNKAVADGRMSRPEAEKVISRVKADALNVTDGQSFMTFSSYKKYLERCGRWNAQMEQSYNAIRNGTFVKEDLDVAFGIMKLFGFGTYDENLTDGRKMKVPFMMKTSCMPLIPLLMTGESTGQVSVGDNSVREGLLVWAEQNDIDFICFKSAIKVGSKNTIDISSCQNGDDVIEVLNSTRDKMSVDGIAMTVPYSDIGVIQETPQHYLDSKVVTGTQKIKHLLDSLTETEPGKCVQLNGKWLSKQDVIDLYNELLTADVAEDFCRFAARVSDKEEFFAMLDELNSNSDYGTETVREYYSAADVPIGAIPNSDSAQANAFSAAAKKIVRRMTNGSSYIQATSFGLTKNLKVRTNTDGQITGIECTLPLSSRAMLSKYLKQTAAGRMELDINSVPEELRKAIGVRIPTEGYSSMKPLIIVGFTPKEYGGMIMMPYEVMALDGSDFDVDKVFVTLPFFEVVRDNDALLEAFNTESGTSYSEEELNELPEDDPMKQKLTEFLSSNKGRFDAIQKVQYDPSKSALENSAAARANMFLDLSFALLTSTNGTQQMFGGGGFDMIKTASLVTRFLERTGAVLFSRSDEITEQRNKILSSLKREGITINKEASVRDIYTTLCSAPLGSLTNLVNEFSQVTSLANPSRDINYFSRVSLGSTLIGIYAVNSAAQSSAQISGLSMIQPIVIDGKAYKSLSATSVEDSLSGEKYAPISYVGAKQAASVDMAKDDSLGEFRQNRTTAAWGMLLSRAGVHPNVEVLLMNQPITKHLIEKIESGMSFRDSVKSFFGDDAYAAMKEKFTKSNQSKFRNLLVQDLLLGAYSKDSLEQADYLELQWAVASLLESVNMKGNTLTRLNNATRYDKKDNSLPFSIAGYIAALIKGTTARQTLAGNKAFTGVDPYVTKRGDGIRVSKTNYEQIQETVNPLQTSFLHYGVYNIGKLFRQFFPELSQKALNMVYGNGSSLYALLKANRSNASLEDYIKRFHSSMRSFTLVTHPSFMTYDGKVGSAAFKALMRDFPYKLNQMKEKYPGNEFLKSLSMTLSPDTSYYIIRADNLSHYTMSQQDGLSNDWLALYRSSNDETRQFAIDLFKYAALSNQSHGAFFALAPREIAAGVPGYIDAIEREMEQQWSIDFMTQFLRNYYYLDALVPIKSEKNYEETADGIRVKAKYAELDTGFPIPVIKTIEKDQTLKQGKKERKVNLYKLWVAKSIAEGRNEEIADRSIFVEYVPTTPLGMSDKGTSGYIMSTSPEFDAENPLGESVFEENSQPLIERYLKSNKKPSGGIEDVLGAFLDPLASAETDITKAFDLEPALMTDIALEAEAVPLVDASMITSADAAKFKPTLVADENNDLLC